MIKVGLDFDGVVAYNPIRIARLVVSLVKHKICKVRNLGFFNPKNEWQKRLFYMAVVVPSVWPANGTSLLKILSNKNNYKFYLITGRYGFVKQQTLNWLKKYDLLQVFEKIYINEENIQPHEFKRNIIEKEKFDYFIEDNLDVVKFLSGKFSKTKILWIYNILDKYNDFQFKYPDLKRALESIVKNENIS